MSYGAGNRKVRVPFDDLRGQKTSVNIAKAVSHRGGDKAPSIFSPLSICHPDHAKYKWRLTSFSHKLYNLP